MASLGNAQAILQVGGAATSAISKARVQAIDAKSLDIASRSEIDQAEFDERQQRRVGDLFMGATRSATAASGVDVSQGSPLFAALDQAKQNEIQALSIRRAGKVRSGQLKFLSRTKKAEMVDGIIGGLFSGVSQGLQGSGSILESLGK